MSPYILERVYERIGRPAWFWPVIWGVLFVLMIVGGSIGSEP